MKIERVQTGVRLERRIVKVLKGLAEYHDISMGELLEGIVLHALEGTCALTSPESRKAIASLRELYGLDLTAADSHGLVEGE